MRKARYSYKRVQVVSRMVSVAVHRRTTLSDSRLEAAGSPVLGFRCWSDWGGVQHVLLVLVRCHPQVPHLGSGRFHVHTLALASRFCMHSLLRIWHFGKMAVSSGSNSVGSES